jgi:hypothetical protein
MKSVVELLRTARRKGRQRTKRVPLRTRLGYDLGELGELIQIEPTFSSLPISEVENLTLNALSTVSISWI